MVNHFFVSRGLMLVQCWAIVFDAGPTLSHLHCKVLKYYCVTGNIFRAGACRPTNISDLQSPGGVSVLIVCNWSISIQIDR